MTVLHNVSDGPLLVGPDVVQRGASVEVVPGNERDCRRFYDQGVLSRRPLAVPTESPGPGGSFEAEAERLAEARDEHAARADRAEAANAAAQTVIDELAARVKELEAAAASPTPEPAPETPAAPPAADAQEKDQPK